MFPFPVMMARPTTDTILRLFLYYLSTTTVLSLDCYDSSYPVPNHKTTCAKDQMCYSEYYAINKNGTIHQNYERFCVYESDCLFRGIDEKCPSIKQLDHKMRSTFLRKQAKTPIESILFSEFCCCSTNLCNDVNHKRVYDKYGLQISMSDSLIHDVSTSSSNIYIFSLLIPILSYILY